jgi:hypothetical protein
MRESTAENLERQQKALGGNAGVVAQLQSFIKALLSDKS